jgi:hypothetical protein
MRLVLVALLIACQQPETVEAPLGVLSDTPGPIDALSRRHARIRERMRRRGYGEEIGLTRDFVLEERGISMALDLRVGSCDTFAALGGGSIRQLVLSLFDDEGHEAATDAAGGEAGLLHVCPQGGREGAYRAYYLVVRSTEGSGAFLLAHFRSGQGEGEGFDGVFDSVLAPRAPLREVEELLARSRTAFRARGFSPLGPAVLDHLSEGAVLRIPLTLEHGRCYVVAARSGEGLRDADLFLFDGAGVEVARDLAANAEPTLEHCPAESGPFTAEVRAFEGSGAVGLMAFSGPAVASTPEPEPVERSHSDPSSVVAVLTAPLERRGFAPPVFVARDAVITPGEVRSHEVVIGPGCGIVAGAASHDGIDLDLYLTDVHDAEVDRDTAVHSTARVRACRPQATVFRVAVKAYGRDGRYALATVRAPETIQTLQGLRLEEATAPYRLRGYVESISLATELAQGGRFTHPLVLAPQRCVALAAAGDDGVTDLDLFLRTGAGELVASESGPAPHAAVHRCTTTGEELSLEVAMYGGRGNVSILGLEGP